MREQRTVARASFIRVTCKITWRRYHDLIHALKKKWNEETGEHEVVVLPYGTRVPLLPS
jgi:ABC-type sulfate transport system substrate-binding protein